MAWVRAGGDLGPFSSAETLCSRFRKDASSGGQSVALLYWPASAACSIWIRWAAPSGGNISLLPQSVTMPRPLAESSGSVGEGVRCRALAGSVDAHTSRWS